MLDENEYPAVPELADVDTRALARLCPIVPVVEAVWGSVVYDEFLPAVSDRFRRDRQLLFRFGTDHVVVRCVEDRIDVAAIGAATPAAMVVESRTQDTYPLDRVPGGFAGPRPREGGFRVVIDVDDGRSWSTAWVPPHCR